MSRRGARPLPERWRWSIAEGEAFDSVCPNDSSHALKHVTRWIPGTDELAYFVCKKCRERVGNAAKYAKRTPAQRRRAALMSKRWRLNKRIEGLQAELAQVEGELEATRPGRGRRPAAGRRAASTLKGGG